MSKKEKLIKRILSRPKDFTTDELDTLMKMCGCSINNRGATSGSAKKYIGKDGVREFRFHRPHPQKELPKYVIDAAIGFLREEGEL